MSESELTSAPDDEDPSTAQTLCDQCEEPKVPGTQCKGNDECNEGADGGPAECCEGWGPYCCRCGHSYALGQLP